MSDSLVIDAPMAEYDATCRTVGCVNAGIALRVPAAAESPNVICGPCAQPISELVWVEAIES